MWHLHGRARYDRRRYDQRVRAKHNARVFPITEDATQGITTIQEMVDLLDAADHDLAQPDLNQDVIVPYFPWGEAGDYYTFEANGVHYDADQSQAAHNIRHDLSTTKGRSVLSARGKPSLGATRWLEAEGRPGVAPPADIFQHAATTVTANPAIAGVDVQFDDPRAADPKIADWSTSRVYASTQNGFTPSGTPNAEGRQTHFNVGGLVEGITYYVKVHHIDARGNIGAESTQVSTAALGIGPSHINLDTELGNLIPNGDFGVTSYPNDETTEAPDNWVTVDGSSDVDIWGSSDEVYFESTAARTETSKRSVRVDRNASVNPGVRSKDFFPMSGDAIYYAEWAIQGNDATPTALVQMEMYDISEALTQTVSFVGTIPVVADIWFKQPKIFRTDADTRLGRCLMLSGEGVSGGIIYFDRARLYRALSAFRVYDAAGAQVIATGAGFTAVAFDTEAHDHGSDFDLAGSDDYTAPDDGENHFSGGVTLGSVPDGDYVQVAIAVGGTTVVQGEKAYNASGGTDDITATVSTDSLELFEAEAVTLTVRHSNGGNLSTVVGEATVYFSGGANK